MELPQVEQKHKEYLESKIKGATLQNNLRASSVGTPCDRYHYYALTEYREPYDIGLQAIFDEGNLHEADIEKKLRDMGFEVEGKQKAFRFEDPLITAHIDGMLREPQGEWYPYDAKSINPYDFESLKSAEDLIHSKKLHQRNYCVQILLYMMVTNSEYGCLIFKNKQSGMIRDIWFSFDEHVEHLDKAIKRATRVYEAKAKKKVPERTKYEELCERCEFKHVCLPDLKYGEGFKTLDNETLIDLLNKREKIKDNAKEFEKIDKQIKKIVVTYGPGESIVDDYLIKVKEIVTTRKIPLTWDEEKSSYLKTTILRIEK